MRPPGREGNPSINENWSAEERQVQRTLALLRGIRLNNEVVPRRINRDMGLFGRPQHIDEPAAPNRREQFSKETSLQELTSIFAPLSAREVLDIIQKAKLQLNANRKKFIKPKDNN